MRLGSRSGLWIAIALAAAVLCVADYAAAGPILSPTSAVINSGGPGFGDINNTLNHAGLLVGFTSGVTDFDTYMAANPLHTFIFACCEWFSEANTTSASVTYDLGAASNIDALALWNEESSGIGTLNLFTSLDGISFSLLVAGLLPTDHNHGDFDYPADVFSFGSVNARYIRFDMSDCPQPDNDFPSCAIGEVAFRTAAAPEPGSLALLGIGLGALVLRNRSKKG
jgi:F5/8 type C domain/PEP-CTERM motif